MAEQLTFDLPVRTSRDRGDFFVSEANRLAVARLEDTGSWPGGKLALVGPEGSGKSHLAHVWAEVEGGEVVTPEALVGRDIAGIDHAVAVDVTATDRRGAVAEETLFHLHNHMAAQGLPLLMVARTPPARWDVALPDLKSRMQATDVVEIGPPDDALLAAVLVKLFADRQLQVAPAVIAWLTARMDRSFAGAQSLVAALDEAALAEGRAVTTALARRVMDNRPNEGQ